MTTEMFDSYRSSAVYDELFEEDGNIRPRWKIVMDNLMQSGLEHLHSKQKEIDWRLEDNGVTYNVYNEQGGMNRPWKLDAIPLVIDGEEWKEIEAGLEQRCKLLNLILQDIYGEQRMIREGIIPMETVYAHSGFMREVQGLEMQLTFYAADMARGPDGKMWVINDRTQAPSGLGYAIENRLTMNDAMPELLNDVSVKRLYDFFEKFKSLFPSQNGYLNVLLSPGAHNETYFEHAYLSSFLGLTLVQGQDLLAKNGGVWLKSLKGLRRVGSILRRVDEAYCDPLELRNDSQLGVPGLVQSVRQNGVRMVNPIGSGILENLGLNPFMPRLARFFLGEELLLPQIATWWCGQEKERAYVLENLHKLIIKTIDRSESKHTYIGRQLGKKELKLLQQKILEQPFRYVGQEEVEFGSCPTLVKNTIEPRKAVIRAFTIWDGQSCSVMPGGLVRVGIRNDSLLVSNQFGGSSKDLWILGNAASAPFITFFKPQCIGDNDFETIPSMRAENLFWLGRYLMRAISTARLIRTTLKYVTNSSRYNQSDHRSTKEVLAKALTHVTMTYPGFLKESANVPLLEEIHSICTDGYRIGTMAQTMNMMFNANASVKNLFPMEGWRIVDRMMRDWEEESRTSKPFARLMINQMDKTLLYLMAYKELISESLFAEQGLLLYEIGSRIERAQLLISQARALLTPVLDPLSEYEILETLLSSCESLNAYRARYRASLQLQNVVEFLILDINFPKSLISEVNELLQNVGKLPKFRKAIYLSRYEESIFEAYSLLRLSKLDELCKLEESTYVRTDLDHTLSALSEKLIVASNEITKIYFTHYDE